MPLDASGCDGPGEFVLVFVSAFIEEMYLVGGCDSNGWVDGYIGNSDSDDSLMIVFEVFDFCFGEKTHQSNYI